MARNKRLKAFIFSKEKSSGFVIFFRSRSRIYLRCMGVFRRPQMGNSIPCERGKSDDPFTVTVCLRM